MVKHFFFYTGWRKRGFTLIELLVVLSIVALLLTVAVPRYFGAVDKSKEQVLQENLRVMRVVIDRFYADKGRWPASLEELTELRYIPAVPMDPVTESTNTWILLPPEDAEETGVAGVKSGASGSTKDGRSYDSL